MLCRRGLGCENSWSACELFNKLCSNFIIIKITSGRAGCIPVVVPWLRTVPGLNAPNGCFGGEPGASWRVPSDAVGAVQAQKDQTCNITSSFRVQALAIWALA